MDTWVTNKYGSETLNTKKSQNFSIYFLRDIQSGGKGLKEVGDNPKKWSRG